MDGTGEDGNEYRWEGGYEKTWESIQEDKDGMLDVSVQVQSIQESLTSALAKESTNNLNLTYNWFDKNKSKNSRKWSKKNPFYPNTLSWIIKLLAHIYYIKPCLLTEEEQSKTICINKYENWEAALIISL